MKRLITGAASGIGLAAVNRFLLKLNL